MNQVAESSDVGVLNLLRRSGALGIGDLAAAMRVTPTAVRQRLARLMAQGLVSRETAKAARGRPSHRYALTEKGRRDTGANFADLALALWGEIRGIQDTQVRRGLLGRLARRMASLYQPRVTGRSTAQRMHALAGVFAERDVPFEVDESGKLPVLTAVACPYPDLAEQDRGICSLERMMFSELVGESLRLSSCRLDGDNCCRFQSG